MKQQTEDGSMPLRNPRHEIFACEVGSGMSPQDAGYVAGLGWELRQEQGERVCSTKSQIARQTLRRVDARLAVLVELERGLNMTEHREFLLRNKRVSAELRWFRMVVEYGGVEPEEDSDGNLLPLPKKTKKPTPPQDSKGRFLPAQGSTS